jgi:hypothetical protein
MTQQPDIPMLRKVLAQIDAVRFEPMPVRDEDTGQVTRVLFWEQTSWRESVRAARLRAHGYDHNHACGTSMCFAGWTAELDDEAEWSSAYPNSDAVLVSDSRRFEGTHYEHVETWARDRLGLTDAQANVLFSAANDYDALVRIVDALESGETYIIDEDAASYENPWNEPAS